MKKDLSDIITNDFNMIEGSPAIVYKAKNVLQTQLKSVYYLQDFGCDLEFYILDQKYNIQTQAFKNYLVDRLINAGVEVATIFETLSQFSTIFEMNLTEPTE